MGVHVKGAEYNAGERTLTAMVYCPMTCVSQHLGKGTLIQSLCCRDGRLKPGRDTGIRNELEMPALGWHPEEGVRWLREVGM